MNIKQTINILCHRMNQLEEMIPAMSKDIKDYNSCIDDMIAGGDPCKWCEDYPDCTSEKKGRGCPDWMLRWPKEEKSEQ